MKSLPLLLSFLFTSMTLHSSPSLTPFESQKESSFDATGKIFRLDLQKRSFDLLKETAIDPTTSEGNSRYLVHFDNNTRFTEEVIQNNFKDVKGTSLAYFYDLDQGKLDESNAASAKQGKAFVALKVCLLAEGDDPSAFKVKANSVLGLFNADPASENFREGRIIQDGKEVPVRLRGPGATVVIRKPIQVENIGSNGWEASLTLRLQNNRFMAEKVDVVRRTDPREVDDPKLPRILIIGDSISMNYHDAAKEALKGVANYYRNDGNAGPSDRGTTCIDLWLGDHEQPGLHWDLIQFNFGLHDLKQMFDETSQSYGDYQLAPEAYKKNLESVILQLKKTGAKLVWCTTTPVPNNSTGTWGDKVMGRRKDEDLVYNRAALEVLKNHPDISVNDINSFIRQCKGFDTWRQQSDVHFWSQDLQSLIGQAVADHLKGVLGEKRAKP